MTTQLLEQHKIIWTEKPVLRAVYHDYYQRILSYLKPGVTLEVGGGTGNLKNWLPSVVSTDILTTPWIDVACDAQSLPFASESFDNMVAVDVLHHIERPIRFVKEASRTLKKGGRIVFLEPAITKMSWFFYHFFHPEPVVLTVDPLLDGPLERNREAFDANQAVSELILGKFYQKFTLCFPELIFKHKSYLSLWVYPLSGGFRKWCLIPEKWVHSLLYLERYLEKFLGKHMGFRILFVIEKESSCV